MKRFGKKSALVLAVSIALLASAGLVGSGWAVPIVCGDTITVSTTLTADIGPCAQDGLIIGADGITLDLNGHRISGLGVPAGAVGVRSDNHSKDGMPQGGHPVLLAPDAMRFRTEISRWAH